MTEGSEWPPQGPDRWESDSWAKYGTSPAPAETTPARDTDDHRDIIRPIFGRKEFAAITAAALLVGGMIYGAATRKHPKPRAAAAVVQPPCPTPSYEAVQAVNKLFDGSFNPEQPILGPKAAARKFGMTYFEQSKFITGIGVRAADEGFSEATAQDMSASQKYLDRFGIKLQTGSRRVIPGYRNPTGQEIRNFADNDLSEIDWSLRFTPVEYVHLSGLKKIVLMMAKPASNGGFTYYYGSGTAYWNIAGTPAFNSLDESLAYGLDYRECRNSMARDPSYAAFNPRPNIYGSPEHHKGLLSADAQPSPADQKRGNAILKAFDEGNYKKYCQLIDIGYAKEHRMVVADQYGFNSLDDDKDELAAEFNWPYNNYTDMLSPAHPVLRNKFKFLLARLYDQNPDGTGLGKRLVEFFAAYSGRPTRKGGIVDCSKY